MHHHCEIIIPPTDNGAPGTIRRDHINTARAALARDRVFRVRLCWWQAGKASVWEEHNVRARNAMIATGRAILESEHARHAYKYRLDDVKVTDDG